MLFKRQLFSHDRAYPVDTVHVPGRPCVMFALPFCPLSASEGWSCPKPNLVSLPPIRPGQDRPSLYLDTTQPIKVLPLHIGFVWTNCAEI